MEDLHDNMSSSGSGNERGDHDLHSEVRINSGLSPPEVRRTSRVPACKHQNPFHLKRSVCPRAYCRVFTKAADSERV